MCVYVCVCVCTYTHTYMYSHNKTKQRQNARQDEVKWHKYVLNATFSLTCNKQFISKYTTTFRFVHEQIFMQCNIVEKDLQSR